MKKIACIMSTYNGEKYIYQQLESIYNQKTHSDIEVKIIVRDDGSIDGTIPILKHEQAKGKISLILGQNIGCTKSFFELLKCVGDADFIAFSDQDDVWLENKLQWAVDCLSEISPNIPALYTSEYIFADAALQHKHLSNFGSVGRMSFVRQLFENRCSGNTMLINNELAKRVLIENIDSICIHDWWISLVAIAIGKHFHDTRPTLIYRRLGNNVSSTGTHGIKLLQSRLRAIKRGNQLNQIRAQLNELYSSFRNEMNESDRQLICMMVTSCGLKKAFYPKRYRTRILDDFIVRVLLLVGLL